MTTSVAIIGGGISGLGAALAARRRGWMVSIFERDVIGCGASDNSLRIIHGGFRYLQHFDLPRIVRSLRDQERVRQLAPNLVRRLPCWMPLRRFGLRTRLPMTAATHVYRCIGRAVGIPATSGAIVDRETVAAHCPGYLTCAPHGVFAWDDLLLKDPRAFLHTLSDRLRSDGVSIQEHCAVSRISGASAQPVLEFADGERRQFDSVINCSGAWIADLAGPEVDRRRSDRWVLGFNAIWNRRLLETPQALGFEGPDGRLFFLVQRESDVALGTAYASRIRGAFHPPEPLEVDEFLNAARAAWPEIPIRHEPPGRIEWGILPRGTAEDAAPEPLGNFEITLDHPKICTVLSTKFTTFLSQGESAVARLATR